MPQSRRPSTSPVFAYSDGMRPATETCRRILIVEDDYFVGALLEQHLRDAGFHVVGVAMTADEAVRFAERERPDLAVMDVRLAGVRDGIDAAIELRSRYNVPSLFATAHGDLATQTRAEKARPAGWLTKPYSAQLAVATIRKILDQPI
jgi:two-component system, response regulator PdtaR